MNSVHLNAKVVFIICTGACEFFMYTDCSKHILIIETIALFIHIYICACLVMCALALVYLKICKVTLATSHK